MTRSRSYFRNLGFLFLFCFTLFGCSSKAHQDAVARFHDDGRAKPVVALVPVFNRCGADVGWDLSEEFTEHIRSRLLKKQNLCISAPTDINIIVSHLNESSNPFNANTGWIKEAFSAYEYVIFTELVEHDIHPKTLKGSFMDKITPSSELSLTMRLRVFDLRGKKPVVILQELVHQDHLVTKPSDLSEPYANRWKKVTFTVSPMGLAHSQFSKEVVKRIEDYILLSKSR